MPDHGTSAAVTLVVTMRVKPSLVSDYFDLVRPVMETVHREEPDVVLYAMHPHPELPHTFVWIERYATQAALDAHLASPHMTEALPKLNDLLVGPPEVLELRQVLPD